MIAGARYSQDRPTPDGTSIPATISFAPWPAQKIQGSDATPKALIKVAPVSSIQRACTTLA